MTEYRVTRKRINRQDGTYEKGETFEPTEAELSSFGDRLEKVEPDEPEGDDTDSEPVEADSEAEEGDDTENDVEDADSEPESVEKEAVEAVN